MNETHRRIPRAPAPGKKPAYVPTRDEQAAAGAAQEAHRKAAWERLECQGRYVAAVAADPDWLAELRQDAADADATVKAALEEVRHALEQRRTARQVADAVERLHAGLGPGQLDFRTGRLDPAVVDALDRLAAVA